MQPVVVRSTVFDGAPAEVRSWHHWVAGNAAGPISGEPDFDSAQIHCQDGRVLSVQLPRDWESWSDADLQEKLPTYSIRKADVPIR